MRKFLISLTILSLAFGLSACGQKTEELDFDLEMFGVPETGRVLDIGDKSGQRSTTTPGDVLYLKLTGEADSGKQWAVTSPTSGDYLILKDHKVTGLNDPEVSNGQFIDEWWLKIESTGIFDLQFDYGVIGQVAEQTFKLEVISQ